MRRMIPSTLSLIAFEAAARHQSFSRAAEELCHTQSAIGRQIAALEAMVGLKLFHRAKRRVTLTEAGHAYWQQVRAYLGNLEADTLDLIARQGKGGKIEL
ncbi:MAG: LysR family transcriptional regulator, partial [Burkholderiales bacterium]|nr:LysR family transcriptional regulator [Burkholderiales bacterium]